jgi:hypothetical protein
MPIVAQDSRHKVLSGSIYEEGNVLDFEIDFKFILSDIVPTSEGYQIKTRTSLWHGSLNSSQECPVQAGPTGT